MASLFFQNLDLTNYKPPTVRNLLTNLINAVLHEKSIAAFSGG
jgi:hypothetical protein